MQLARAPCGACVRSPLKCAAQPRPSLRLRASSAGARCAPQRPPQRPARQRRGAAAAASAGAGAAVPEPGGQQQPSAPGGGARGNRAVVLGLLGAAAAGAGATALYVSGHASSLQAALMAGPAGRSGLLASFCLIFLSELGDKTFFIAALLAMRLGRWVSFAGSLAALAVMTLISVGIGAACSRVPDALRSSLPVGEIAGVALLVFFGLKALKAARDVGAPGGSSASDEELADAQEAVEEFTAKAQAGGGRGGAGAAPLASVLEVAGLIFLAEWGDRSMLATIALGAAQNPVGVAVGATAGHALATALAVAGGALAGKYVSERTVNLVSGVLFLLFAAATVFTMV
ncbi:GDT1-like protein [Scenedesmus sp. PABB004]|nr:GDT1-like protein [Scenedesmus sp. PABB004]